MKSTLRFFVLLLSISLFAACQKVGDPGTPSTSTPVVQTNQPENTDPTAVPEITFDHTSHRFGEIPKDVPVKHRFTFKNTGTADLIITSAKPQCGCTVTKFTEEPVKPGETGFVDAEFNAKAVGTFTKSVNVITNTETKNYTLAFEGEVIE